MLHHADILAPHWTRRTGADTAPHTTMGTQTDDTPLANNDTSTVTVDDIIDQIYTLGKQEGTRLETKRFTGGVGGGQLHKSKTLEFKQKERERENQLMKWWNETTPETVWSLTHDTKSEVKNQTNKKYAGSRLHLLKMHSTQTESPGALHKHPWKNRRSIQARVKSAHHTPRWHLQHGEQHKH